MLRVVHVLQSPLHAQSAVVYLKQQAGAVWIASHNYGQLCMPSLDAWVEVVSFAPCGCRAIISVKASIFGMWTPYVWTGTVIGVMCPTPAQQLQ